MVQSLDLLEKEEQRGIAATQYHKGSTLLGCVVAALPVVLGNSSTLGRSSERLHFRYCHHVFHRYTADRSAAHNYSPK